MTRIRSIFTAALLFAAALAAFVALPGGSALAAPYTPGTCPTLEVGTTSPAEGSRLEVSGLNYGAHVRVRLTLHSSPIPLGSALTNGAGAFSTTVTLPSGVTGHHTIVGSDNTKCPSAAVNITISTPTPVPPPTPQGGPSPAYTGVAVLGLGAMGTVMLIGGGLLLLLGRRRQVRA